VAGRPVAGWPRFRRYWAGHLVSFVGDYFTLLALPAAALRLTGSATVVGVVEFAEMSATVVVGTRVGAWADGRDLRSTLVESDAIRAVVLAVLAAWFAVGAPPWPALVLAAFVLGVVRAGHDAAESALVPALLDGADITRANGRFQISDGVGQIVGSTVAGVVVAAGLGWAFGFDALTFAAAGLAAWSLGRVAQAHLDDHPPSGARARGAAGARAAVDALAAEGSYWRVLVTLGIANVATACFFGQFVAFGQRELHLHAWQIGLTLASLGVGAVMAGAVLDRAGILHRRVVPVAVAAVGAVTIVVGVTRSWPVVIAGFAAIGAAIAASQTCCQASIRHRSFPADRQASWPCSPGPRCSSRPPPARWWRV
jgi:MFS family permease